MLTDFVHKSIYLAPLNDNTIELSKEFTKYKINFLGFIDTYKVGINIYHSNDVEFEKDDCVIIGKTQHWIEIYRQLEHNNCYFEYNKIYYFINEPFIRKIQNIELENKIFQTRILRDSINKLNMLTNKHYDKRAFVLGNGPSLRISDLDSLKNEITFACNKIFLAYKDTHWRPTYYTIEDRLDVDEYLDVVSKLDDSIRFIPDKFIKTNVIDENFIYYPYKNSGEKCKYFSDNLEEGFYSGFTVVYTMLQLAVFMGIKEIYLLGVDFNYHIPANQKENTILESDNKINHFHKDYRKTGDKWFSPNLDLQYEAFSNVKKYAEDHNISIVNLSKNSKLDLFIKKDLRTIL